MAQAVESAGFTVAARLAQGVVDELAAFVRARNPRVVVYDLGPPPVDDAVEKWRELSRQLGTNRAYVLTTTYDDKLELDPGPCKVECILPKPVAFEDVAAAVHRATQW